MYRDMPKGGSKTSIDVLVCACGGLLWNHLYFVFKQQALFRVVICCSVTSDMTQDGARDQLLVLYEKNKSTGRGIHTVRALFQVLYLVRQPNTLATIVW